MSTASPWLWTRHHLLSLGAAAALLACTEAGVVAETIVTKSGQVLKNAVVLSIEGNRITIQHDGGTGRFVSSDIPQAVQNRFRDQELIRKTNEVEELKRELARRQQELQQLRLANERLRRHTDDRPAGAVDDQARREAELSKPREENERLARQQSQPPPTPAPVAAKPSRSLEELPASIDDEVIEVRDLVLYYRTDPAAADRRLTKQTFRVRGVIERFETRLFLRRYAVLLESPDKSVSVVCRFSYADSWKAVYTKQRGRILVAKEGPSELRLLRAGDTITLRARCEGLERSELEFSRCEVLPRMRIP